MFAMEDLKPFFDNANIEINGMNFRLTKEEDMAGELAVWRSKNYKVLATPNFDEVPIPIEVLEIDENGDCNTINVEGYCGEVSSFEQYTGIVKTITKKIIDSHKTQ